MRKPDKDGRAHKMRSLGLGEEVIFSMDDYTSISSDCTRYGKMWGKKFTMKSNNEARTVTVTRIA
ncbi:MAG: hypothetical protein NC418_02470 [Muribaculaceae bacterium]|nr:hypothetical protein [Muribaculaceae bacterium]